MYAAIRSVGAEHTVIVGGLNWAFDLSGIATHALDGYNIAYATHPYDYDGKQIGDWPAAFGFAASKYPIIMTEFGQYCATNTYVADLMNYVESLGIHWTAWAWYVQGCAFPSIISDWNGTPYPGVGETVKRYMAGNVAGTTGTAGTTTGTVAPTTAPTSAPPASGTLNVYADGLSSGFEDYTWSQNYNPADTQFVRSGSKAIRTELVNWWGVYYHSKTNFVASSYNQLVFYVNGGTSAKAADVAAVKLYSTSGIPIGNAVNLGVVAAAGQWTAVSIPISKFGLEASTQISGVAIMSNVGGTQALPATFGSMISTSSLQEPQLHQHLLSSPQHNPTLLPLLLLLQLQLPQNLLLLLLPLQLHLLLQSLPLLLLLPQLHLLLLQSQQHLPLLQSLPPLLLLHQPPPPLLSQLHLPPLLHRSQWHLLPLLPLVHVVPLASV
jgi:hypothetical protein